MISHRNDPRRAGISPLADLLGVHGAETDFLHEVLDGLPTTVVLLDPQGTVLFWNEAELDGAGGGAQWKVGRDFFRSTLPDPAAEELRTHYLAGMATGSMRIEREIQTPFLGGDRTLRLVFRYRAWQNRTFGVVHITDRTEVIREEERRMRAERLASVGELAAGVAHEVNNPLASIKSFAQLLARDVSSTQQREALEIIIQESTRVAGIVDDLLSFARQQGAGGREPVNLSVVAERVLNMQRYALETAGITVRKDFDTSLSAVMGEPGALQQVVLNLIVNAEQALTAREGERLLIVRTRESSEGVILSVIDNGPGIPRQMIGSIFDLFQTTKPGGTGLGLGISAAIVRDHAGQIWAESEEGRGAAFFIRLPRAAAAPTVSSPAVGPAPEARKATRLLRILVADDEPTLRMGISLFLGRRGHTVVQAGDAHEALRLVSESDFDAALVDVRMPGDGLLLLEQLENLPAMRGRTALMTGDIGRARTRQGITTGRPCLTKPFDMDEMVRLVESLGQ